MRVAFFVGSFPEISETFILRQITGLIDLGYEVDIYSDGRPEKNAVIHQDVISYNLLKATTYLIDEMPEASGYWEMPVFPASGETWLPGMSFSIPNRNRIEEASPCLIQCLTNIPKLAFEVLDPEEYGREARSLSALYRLSSLSKQTKKYDIVHAHFGPIGNSFRFVRELWNAPMIVTFHGYDFSSYPLQHGLDIYKNLFHTADVITVNSNYARNRIIDLGCTSPKICNLNVGLGIDEFPFVPRKITNEHLIKILTVGRLVEKKGIEYSIRAFAKVVSKHPFLRYDIIGEGPLRSALQELILELGVQNYVVLHGSKDGAFVRKLMSESQLFILASVTSSNGDQEGTPVSLMEAQACGLPVISTLHSGIPEVVLNGKTGLLVHERDVNSLAEQLNYLIEHPQQWDIIGRRGRKHIEENYQMRKLNEQLVEIYNQAMNNYRGNLA